MPQTRFDFREFVDTCRDTVGSLRKALLAS